MDKIVAAFFPLSRGPINMKLKKLFIFEIASVAAAIFIILLFVEITPYLATSNPESRIGVYSQKLFTQGNVTLSAGQTSNTWFNYSTFDPAVLVIDLAFQSWQTQGRLSVYCNSLLIATIDATPKDPSVFLTAIAMSGFEMVKPKVDLISPAPPEGYIYGNKIAFISENVNGYEGTFSYQISVRGSR